MSAKLVLKWKKSDSITQCLKDLHWLPINKFQRIQNMSAKLVMKWKKNDGATQCLKDLHWLPIKERIIFQMLTLTYKCLHGQAPEYLKKPTDTAPKQNDN